MKKMHGFSLLELMVVIVVIAVVIAVLAPVITKKLKSSSLKINSSSSISEITTQCADNSNFGPACKLCTKSYCINCGLGDCASDQYKDSKRCECKSCTEKYTDLCATCDSNGCLRCKSTAYYINNGACTICPAGSYCDGVNIYATCPGDGYYCDSTGIHKCSEKFSAHCTKCTSSACTKCDNYYFLSGGTCKDCIMTACVECSSTSVCTKCQVDWVFDSELQKCTMLCAQALEGCTRCTGATVCIDCDSKHYLNTSNTCTQCTLLNCQRCTSNRPETSPLCELCDAGYYRNSSGGCNACSSKFGAQCAACNESVCLSCKKGYHVKDASSSSACENDDNKFNCSDSNFMQIGNLCFTRKNMGDSSTLAIPPTVKVVEAGGETCHSLSQKCCWNGITSQTSGCDSENGGYSGCSRTVCNWSAAKEICSNFNYGGKTWRLPTKDELANLAYFYSKKLGESGLMLCDYYIGFSSAGCVNGVGRCLGTSTYKSSCYPIVVWSGSLTDTLHAFTYSLQAGSWYPNSASSIAETGSTRCVTELN